jgi:hypothetical protein
MKTAGVRFDFYDDPSGELLKKHFPTAEELPEIVKTAHILNPEERDVLRDEAYALVMLNEGKSLRKFACVDPGNTLMSVVYFGETMDLLPEEAVKVAAANLHSACEEFGIEPPLFLKTAARTESPKKGSPMARDRDPMRQPVVGDDADWAARTNLLSVQSGKDSGRVNEVSGGLNKGASSQLETAAGQTGKMPCTQNCTPDIPANSDPSANILMHGQSERVVDVSGKTPKHKKEKKSSVHYALDNRYPLDSYADVTDAVQYFNMNVMEFVPRERHMFAVKTAERAEELGITTGGLLDRYGSTCYADDVEAQLARRIGIVQDKSEREMYQELREKRASINPEVFAELLSQADQASGLAYEWGGCVDDPWFSTFGGKNEMQKKASWTWDENPNIDVEALKSIGASQEFQSAFDSSVVSAFNADPVTIFESMPAPQKTIIAGFAKEASMTEHALDVAGLGILAAPTVASMAGSDFKKKNKDRAELAGLGVLAAHPAYTIGKKLLKK